MSDASDSTTIPLGLEGPVPQDGFSKSQHTTRCPSSSLHIILRHRRFPDLWILMQRELAHVQVRYSLLSMNLSIQMQFY